eukprot:PITA_30902
MGRDVVTKLVHQWESIASALEEDLYLRMTVSGTQLKGGQTDVQLTFNGMYLGPLHELLDIVNKSFSEMGMVTSDCKETSWIGSISYTAYTNRPSYAIDTIPKKVTSNRNRISSKALFRHRHGMEHGNSWKSCLEILMFFSILLGYQITWNDPSEDAESIAWIQRLYHYMAAYVSNSPRAAYVNYLDLDLGVAPNGTDTVEEGRSWGEKYFVNNYDRLVKIKSTIDPNNVFRNSQSILVKK